MVEALAVPAVPEIGPIVVVGRPRSGTRLLAALLNKSGVFLGARRNARFLDSRSFRDHFVEPLVLGPYFPDWESHRHLPAFRELVQSLGRTCLESFFDAGDSRCDAKPDAWGWKFAESAFVMPLGQELFPGARFLQLIRDGRDVAFSNGGYFQLSDLGRLGDARHREFCHRVTFGVRSRERRECDGFAALDLDDPRSVLEHRFRLQMRSWIQCVTTARSHGRAGACLEVRYEALCRRPGEEAERICDFVGLPLLDRTRQYLAANAHAGRIGRWRSHAFCNRERRDFDRACAMGAPLLEELGYAV